MSNENITVPQSNIAPTDFKYGDSDICSKRRKCNADATVDNESIAFTECTPTNISLLDFSSIDVSSDFKGGLLNSTTSTSSAQSSPISLITEEHSEKSLLITAKPSQTSKCFENTFKLLQTQLECNAKKAVSVMQSFNVDTSFLNSSISSLPSISESEEPPTHLELELEAMRRVRTLVKNKTSYNISPRFVALLCDFVSKGQHKENEKDHRENCSKDGEQDLRYHAAKNCDGKNCLRVIRTLCSQQGMHYNEFTICIVPNHVAKNISFIYLSEVKFTAYLLFKVF
uniref:Uncharacterized protein n=1 Tax=Bactrocera latifrons TaxID=174628 RepID=A0A0K8UXU7_BACLA